jgi:uncharacterized protein YndB with AHSA1/START domain
MSTDRIEKQIDLKAPRSRVWRALTRVEEFGQWFRSEFDGAFVPGARLTGKVLYPGYEHVRSEITIERMEPETLFSLRWHPNAVEVGKDYASEPTTLVEFRLEEIPGGTRLTVVESGFDRIPLARRAQAFRSNSEGWAIQVQNIERHVAQA